MSPKSAKDFEFLRIALVNPSFLSLVGASPIPRNLVCVERYACDRYAQWSSGLRLGLRNADIDLGEKEWFEILAATCFVRVGVSFIIKLASINQKSESY